MSISADLAEIGEQFLQEVDVRCLLYFDHDSLLVLRYLWWGQYCLRALVRALVREHFAWVRVHNHDLALVPACAHSGYSDFEYLFRGRAKQILYCTPYGPPVLRIKTALYCLDVRCEMSDTELMLGKVR